MIKGKVVITDYGFTDLNQEKTLLAGQNYELLAAQCTTEEEIISFSEGADALLVQWAPVTAKVIEKLKTCKIIVRYGIGVDNVDIEAAKKMNIPVCNVPDYCVNEVADHTMAFAIALGRQLVETNTRMRSGVWKITPPHTMPAFRKMIFATLGCGRIARAVLQRASAFGFRAAAYDPYISDKEMDELNIQKLQLDELFEMADIVSLHLPLTDQTRHMINAERLEQMKSTSILINTSRGGLIDTKALAMALQNKIIAGAGLDVFEVEPLPADDLLWQCDNVILTSHTAWNSDASVSVLQEMAVKEVIRGLKGEPLKNRIV